MPLTPARSNQYANNVAVPPVLNDGRDHGKARLAFGKLTLTAAGNGTAQMARLPGGKIRCFPRLGRIVAPQGLSTSTIAVGLGAYTNEAGSPVIADVDAFITATDLGNAAVSAALLGTASGQIEFVEIASKDGVDVTVTVATANTAAAGDILVSIPYVLAG
jgi:hypothetical protein